MISIKVFGFIELGIRGWCVVIMLLHVLSLPAALKQAVHALL